MLSHSSRSRFRSGSFQSLEMCPPQLTLEAKQPGRRRSSGSDSMISSYAPSPTIEDSTSNGFFRSDCLLLQKLESVSMECSELPESLFEKQESASSNSTLGDEVMALSNLIIESEVDETVFEYDASSEEKLLDDLDDLWNENLDLNHEKNDEDENNEIVDDKLDDIVLTSCSTFTDNFSKITPSISVPISERNRGNEFKVSTPKSYTNHLKNQVEDKEAGNLYSKMHRMSKLARQGPSLVFEGVRYQDLKLGDCNRFWTRERAHKEEPPRILSPI